MSLGYSPRIDDLLADSLIQAMMRADHVEPQALKTLLDGVASRIGGPERALQRPAAVFISSANNSRTPPRRGLSAPAPRRAARVRDARCGTFCC